MQAQELPTLKKVKPTGTIPHGHYEFSIPFSSCDGKRRGIGRSHLEQAHRFLTKILHH